MKVKGWWFSMISKAPSPCQGDAASYRNSSDVPSMSLFPIKNKFLIPSLSSANVRNEVFGSGTERGGAGEPWEDPTPLPLCWVDVDGREQPGRCPLLIPGCSRAENAAFWNLTKVQFPLTQQKKSEPTNSCNNLGKCQKKENETVPDPRGSCHSKWNVYVRRTQVSSQLQTPHLSKAGI